MAVQCFEISLDGIRHRYRWDSEEGSLWIDGEVSDPIKTDNQIGQLLERLLKYRSVDGRGYPVDSKGPRLIKELTEFSVAAVKPRLLDKLMVPELERDRYISKAIRGVHYWYPVESPLDPEMDELEEPCVVQEKSNPQQKPKNKILGFCLFVIIAFLVWLGYQFSEKGQSWNKIQENHARALGHIGNGEYVYALNLLDQDPSAEENPASWLLMGYCHGALEEQTEAVKAYAKSLELDPLSWECHYAYGVYLHHIGRREEALENYKKAAKLKSEEWRPLNGAGRVYLDMHLYKEALVNLNQALEKKGFSGVVHKNKAWALLELGQAKASLEALDKYHQFSKSESAWDEGEFLFVQTRALAQLGRNEEACDSLRKLSQTIAATAGGFQGDLKELEEALGCKLQDALGPTLRTNIVPVTGALITCVSRGAKLLLQDQPLDASPIVREAYAQNRLGLDHVLILEDNQSATLLLSNDLLIHLKGKIRWSVKTPYPLKASTQLAQNGYRKLAEFGGDNLFYNHVTVLAARPRDFGTYRSKAKIVSPTDASKFYLHFKIIFSPVEGAVGYQLTLNGPPSISMDLATSDLTMVATFPWFPEAHLVSYEMKPPEVLATADSMSLTLRTLFGPSESSDWHNESVSDPVILNRVTPQEGRELGEEFSALERADLDPRQRLYLKASLFTRNNLYEEAIPLLEELLATREDADLALWLGELYEAIGWEIQAEICYQRALNSTELRHIKAHALAGQARIACNQGKLKVGLGLIDKALALQPLDAFRMWRKAQEL